jgi:2OG-Fe(II) oxygenase superfamily
MDPLDESSQVRNGKMILMVLTFFVLPSIVPAWLPQQGRPRFSRISFLCDSVKKEAVVPYDDQLLYMGISEELDKLKKGDSLTKVIAPSLFGDHNPRSIQIQKLSQRPPLFLLKGILTLEECQKLQDLALQSGPLLNATTRMEEKEYRQASQFAWISNTHHGLTQWAQQVHAILLPHEPCYHPILSVEELQVVHYDPQGLYNLHHDGALRILTVLYYLNAVSDTWFPLADYKKGRFLARDPALKAASSQEGVRVSQVSPGDAIAFYNYFQDGSFEWNALHAGLPAASDKWIATHWYHHVSPNQCAAWNNNNNTRK